MKNEIIESSAINEVVEINNGDEEYSNEKVDSIDETKLRANIESVRITNRERQIIPLVANGFTNKEIAQKLNLSVYTVKSHIHNILAKLAINKRIQIAIHAYQSEYYKNFI